MTKGYFIMADSRLYVHVLLDRSGSMEDCRDQTISAFNEYVHSLKVQSQAGTRLSLTTFDTESTDLVFDTLRVEAVPKLTRETFVPRGGTPLFDAVSAVVTSIDKVTLLPDERVALAILTDGEENSSREMNAAAVNKLLTDRQERCNWLVQYLGANQNTWAAGAQIGIGRDHAIDFATASVAPAMQSLAKSAGRFRSSASHVARKAASFIDAERSAAKGQKD
jgi:hypothetical protein